MSFRRRTFPEVLDNLLTSVVKGVSAESHPFPPAGTEAAPYLHYLQQPPVGEIVSTYGVRLGQPHLFQKGVDYHLTDDGLSLKWLDGGVVPDPNTLFQVNYHPQAALPVLTDIYTGSVIRTLAESVALEIGRLYAQLDEVYKAGFIDTATGRSLDNVVGLLGVQRVESGRASGEVEFTRSTASRGAINIPAGTRIMDVPGDVEYETTIAVSLTPGQNTVRASARDLESNAGVEANSLTVLPVPIAGVTSVTNPAPTTLSTQDETDAALRVRAKGILHGSERATIGAIENAIKRQGVTADIEEPQGLPGVVEITPHSETFSGEQIQRMNAAIEDSRPAGVLVRLSGSLAAPLSVNLELRLTTVTGLLEQDLRSIHGEARTNIEDYFAELPAGDDGSVNRIVALVLNIPGMEDVRILNATWDSPAVDVLNRENGVLAIKGSPTKLGTLHFADPNLPSRVNIIVSYPEAAGPPDEIAIQSAFTTELAAISEANAVELAADATVQEIDDDLARRTLTYAELLALVPLPDGAPDGTYQVQFVITIESGLSQELPSADDEPYILTPFERLSLIGVELSAVG